MTKETLAAVAERELAGIRSKSVGKVAPQSIGEDVDGKPMKLSEFRGKVVLIDFGSHEHCGGCAAIYPRLSRRHDNSEANIGEKHCAGATARSCRADGRCVA
jgi:thiol-disulfide isomerase/thioredoxin